MERITWKIEQHSITKRHHNVSLNAVLKPKHIHHNPVMMLLSGYFPLYGEKIPEQLKNNELNSPLSFIFTWINFDVL